MQRNIERAPIKNYRVESIELFHEQALPYQQSKYIMIMRLKCEVGCEKIQLSPLLGKNEITFRTTFPIEIVSFVAFNCHSRLVWTNLGLKLPAEFLCRLYRRIRDKHKSEGSNACRVPLEELNTISAKTGQIGSSKGCHESSSLFLSVLCLIRLFVSPLVQTSKQSAGVALRVISRSRTAGTAEDSASSIRTMPRESLAARES